MKCKFVEELTKIYQSNLDTDVIKLACLEIMGNKKSGLREGQDGLWFLGWQSTAGGALPCGIVEMLISSGRNLRAHHRSWC